MLGIKDDSSRVTAEEVRTVDIFSCGSIFNRKLYETPHYHECINISIEHGDILISIQERIAYLIKGVAPCIFTFAHESPPMSYFSINLRLLTAPIPPKT